MASWEDYADDPDLIPESTTKSTVPEETKQQNPQGTAETAAKTAPAPTAPPKPSNRGGASESSNAGQAYMAAQPKVRILQRAAPANPASRGPSPGQSVADSDESVARLHANYEQKQRDYEAARKKLFDESQAVEESS
jgi:hypothetical protein